MNQRLSTLFVVLTLAFGCAEQGSEPQGSAPIVPAVNRGETTSRPTPRDAASGLGAPAEVQAVFNQYCTDCHGQTKPKGRVRLDSMVSLNPVERAELLNKAHEAIHFGEMPPDDKPQPGAAELKRLMDWLTNEVELAGGSDFKDKLRYPDYGNLVDHDQLFSGQIKEKAYTPARRWLVSPQIFEQRVMDVFKLEGQDRVGVLQRGFAGVTNPFLLTDHSGVRYYDIDALDGGDLLVMLGNAAWIADRQVAIARKLGGEQVEFDNPKDRWMPRQAPASYQAFVTIIKKQVAPTTDEMTAAIREQFDCVLRREPSAKELSEYMKLLRSSIQLGGNAAGLRQMLMTVLLESEFVYRLEFGGGREDAYGRKMLTGREGAYAISYALGDRGPDAQLLEAAAKGRLNSKADYRREVERLLADETYYRGQVDPTISGPHYKSNETSHPKIVRFFREFFGYPAASKVFKDPPRIDNIYRNPDRGTAGTPGRLILETDRMVTLIVEQDRDVFKELLTSDRFFVYHDKSNEEGEAILAEWREVYSKLKDTDWKTNPEQVLKDNFPYLKDKKTLRIEADKPGLLVNYMRFFEEHFGKGIQPFTTPPWAHGYYWNHSPLYSLNPTPERGRFGSWQSTKYTGNKIEPMDFWDYPATQPFKIENRMGILTHPSWLIAHSQNFHSDPIRRGRWIREKLLAGRVPDVPITVDAQVPEDPDKTFRTRVEEVTAPDDCWKCHKHMNPLGLAFEAFDDFGRYRTEELLEHPDNLIPGRGDRKMAEMYPTAPIDMTGVLSGTGDSELDGPVANPFELIDRLAKSDRVRQSMIRHAFRFYMGRNEMLSDSQTLIDADRAYLNSGGSFKAVIVSLLTSDSFMYRKEVKE